MIEDILFWAQSNWRSILEVLILTAVIYAALKLIQQARGLSIVRGMLLVATVAFVSLYFVARWADLPNINWLLTRFIPFMMVTLLIIFQPEIRHALVRIGQHNQFMRFFPRKKSAFVKKLVNTAFKLSSRKIGALIALQREDSLNRYAEGGVKVGAELTPDLVMAIFWPNSPLHDGGMIVSDERILAAGCLFPLSERPDLPPNLGTRHRAGVGLTEETDAVVLIVYEETGRVSVAVRGHLTYDVKMEALESILNELYAHEEPGAESTLEVSKES